MNESEAVIMPPKEARLPRENLVNLQEYNQFMTDFQGLAAKVVNNPDRCLREKDEIFGRSEDPTTKALQFLAAHTQSERNKTGAEANAQTGSYKLVTKEPEGENAAEFVTGTAGAFEVLETLKEASTSDKLEPDIQQEAARLYKIAAEKAVLVYIGEEELSYADGHSQIEAKAKELNPDYENLSNSEKQAVFQQAINETGAEISFVYKEASVPVEKDETLVFTQELTRLIAPIYRIKEESMEEFTELLNEAQQKGMNAAQIRAEAEKRRLNSTEPFADALALKNARVLFKQIVGTDADPKLNLNQISDELLKMSGLNKADLEKNPGRMKKYLNKGKELGKSRELWMMVCYFLMGMSSLARSTEKAGQETKV